MNLSFLLNFLSNHQTLSYLILFLSSLFETIIGFSFFVYGEIFFLSGSILAGMGILNIWLVIFVLYSGGIAGDSISYFLGKKYGLRLYKYLEGKPVFRRYINKKNYAKGFKFFDKYGKYSVFFARFLGPVSWITPFLAGVHKLNYKVFLKYDIPAVILGIGQFIIVGYFMGMHYEVLLGVFFKYLFIFFFVALILILILIYLKKRRYFSKFKRRWKYNKKRLAVITMKHFALIVGIMVILFCLFLFYLSFIYGGHNNFAKPQLNRIISLNYTYLNNCDNFNTYYLGFNSNIIQPINLILITNKNMSKILDVNWIKNNIFKEEKLPIKKFFKSVKHEVLPVSNLYVNNISQDIAYQYKDSSLIKREHIRFWDFVDKDNSSQKIYLGSISNDNGFTLEFYNYFLAPIHQIDPKVDKSRDFFYSYLLSRNDFNMTCGYMQTDCGIKKLKHTDDQQYYTDGKILLCRIR